MTIKASKLPIICICNDKYHQKLRSLRNHCLEFEFRCALYIAQYIVERSSFHLTQECQNQMGIS